MKASHAVSAALVVLTLSVNQPAFSITHHRHSDSHAVECEVTNGPVAEYVTDVKASIGWSTNIKGHMRLRFGTGPSQLSQVFDAVEKDHGRNHHVSVEGLKPDTQYFFQVIGSNDEAVDEVGTFRTLRPGAIAVASHIIVP